MTVVAKLLARRRLRRRMRRFQRNVTLAALDWFEGRDSDDVLAARIHDAQVDAGKWAS